MSTRVSGRFIEGSAGALAIVDWIPADRPPHTRILYVPPFGDEMNKSRRIVATQARSLAARGFAVSALDLRGTGDSAGEHADATWEGWRDDVRVAWQSLHAGEDVPTVLWGLRLGALLACDVVTRADVVPAMLLLWQPVTSGRTFFNQLLRGMPAQRAAESGRESAAASKPRDVLRAGTSIAVGGYAIAPALVDGAELANPADVPRITRSIYVRECSIAAHPAPSPALAKLAAGWTNAGAQVDIAAIAGPSFWSTQELAEAPGLIASTTAALDAARSDVASR